MPHLADLLLVGLALLISALYALIALGPRSWRGTAAASFAALAARSAALPGLRAALLRLSVSLAGKPRGSCGGCASCGTDAAAGNAAAAESRVPVGKLGMRRRASGRSSGR